MLFVVCCVLCVVCCALTACCLSVMRLYVERLVLVVWCLGVVCCVFVLYAFECCMFDVIR